MAEAFLNVVIDNLSSLIQGKIGLILGVDKEMKKLSDTLTTIQKVLEDAEDKQFRNKSIQHWLGRLNDMAYEIEDILDECQTEVSKRRGGNLNLKKVLYKYKIGRRMKEAVEKLESIAEDRHKFHLQEIVVQNSNQVDWRRETGFVLNEPDHIYGRDEVKEKTVDLLVNQVKDCKQLSVLPIIGMGGMGKTTVAQLVFNDERVSQHFDTKLWICVSDDFDLKAILSSIIESATGVSPNSGNLSSLQYHLRQELNGKRYLLVLDDVWNDNQDDWVKLKSILACGSIGASIVVTTRMKKVADIMGTMSAHCLAELSEEHCWLLFRLRAFGQENEEHNKLEAIGRRIVKKCGGVPLVAKALGGLLRFRREEKEWIRIEEKLSIWSFNGELVDMAEEFKHLQFLKRLTFKYVYEMVSLPQGLQHIISLQSLTLFGLDRLTSLPDWLPNLVSLTILKIVYCTGIPSLPSCIREMRNLRCLEISECSQLQIRCVEPNGEDWHKIAHIPRLNIDYPF